jgi:transglutaminase-like putative cysteine protease
MTPQMKNLLSIAVLLSSFFLSIHSFAQKKNAKNAEESGIKFGEVTLSDFDPQLHSFDSTADAVILYDKGYSYFKESKSGWFTLTFERHQRIKVLNKNGMDAGNFIIPQYKSGKSEELIEQLKAITFNVENGEIVATPLNEKEIFKDQLNRNYNLTKFGMPNVKEGSIIDVTYTVNSTFLFNLRAWEFQGKYPRVHSEYTTKIPEFFVYIVVEQGFIPFYDLVEKSQFKTYDVKVEKRSTTATPLGQLNTTVMPSSQVFAIPTNDKETKYVMKEVPALKSEPFTTTIDNYVVKISFQLIEYRFPGEDPQPIMSSWPKLGEELLKDDEFGGHFARNTLWLNDEVKTITSGASTDLEKAKALYTYWRNKFTVSNPAGKYMTDNPKNIWKNAKGNPADANIVLALLLRTAGLKADPVLMSTRDNGFANEDFPLVNQYNYVVCMTRIDNKGYYLDATNPFIGFGYLPLECYNGHARIIQPLPMPVYLEADSLKENKTTIINYFGDGDMAWKGTVKTKMGYYESLSLREKLKNEGQERLERDLKKALPLDVEIEDVKVENVKDFEEPIRTSYAINLSSLQDADIIYLNPLAGEQTKENPFAAAERKYPVEMPFSFRETIISNVHVPQGYEVDEMPKATKVKLEGDAGIFEYIIQKQENTIQLRCVLDIKKANFAPEEYSLLRDFFTYVVNKQAEQIVLKKKTTKP